MHSFSLSISLTDILHICRSLSFTHALPCAYCTQCNKPQSVFILNRNKHEQRIDTWVMGTHLLYLSVVLKKIQEIMVVKLFLGYGITSDKRARESEYLFVPVIRRFFSRKKSGDFSSVYLRPHKSHWDLICLWKPQFPFLIFLHQKEVT